MGRGGVQRTKRPELHERYDKQPQPKAKRQTFRERVVRYGYTKEQSLRTDNGFRRQKRNQHIVRDENGRVCNKCNQYKPRDEFSYNKVGFHKRNSTCKVCKNKAHAEYRLNGGYEKDREYKHRKRYLEKGDQIYFHGQIREVIEYKNNKGYKVKSIVDGTERRISTGDNQMKTTRNVVKFVKIENPVVLMRTREKPQFKVKPNGEIYELTAPKKQFSISLDPDEDDEEYYY